MPPASEYISNPPAIWNVFPFLRFSKSWLQPPKLGFHLKPNSLSLYNLLLGGRGKLKRGWSLTHLWSQAKIIPWCCFLQDFLRSVWSLQGKTSVRFPLWTTCQQPYGEARSAELQNHTHKAFHVLNNKVLDLRHAFELWHKTNLTLQAPSSFCTHQGGSSGLLLWQRVSATWVEQMTLC